MMDFLQQSFMNNTFQEWLTAAGVAVATVLLLRLLQALFHRRLSKLAKLTSTKWDDYAVEMIADTKLLFLIIAGLVVGSTLLELPGERGRLVTLTFVIALLVQAGLWGRCLIASALEDYRQRKLDENPAGVTTLGVINFSAQTVLWSVVLLLILENLGVDITALVAGLGIGGVAVALALQTVLGDLFASLAIVLDKPFVVGDFLMIGDFLGVVEKVGLKTTRIRSLSGEQLIFSNNDLLGSRIRNYGRMYERRVVFKLGVTYQTCRDRLKAIPGLIREAIEGEDNTRFDRSHFSGYGDFSLNFETVYYVLSPDYNEHMDIQQSVYLKIHEAFENQGVEFAYPTQTLFIERPGGEETGVAS
ncbi:MAG: mechanosensitive ion channel family protein [Xanthomonadales bacterium]|nr:mechanosensitive ion channel family protein [Gammaproteobacteria bacterium]MBT8050782.1 mechanosensitive ion channel family protein [Gammaproteobacteria bacterium]MBT8055722.1 mechanosensitive ion channel family protein [Gammaproteobacteria bacterium]NNJ79941.1 mechanosensitive ion channel family protein [Xanthomonadales bacterium]NNL05759.1 mechanosensitive ion channel family protein [Xanthomonadales bacterium]